VASQDKGHAELVDHGVNGYIFQQGNAQEFIDDLVSLYESKELRQRMGAESKIKSQKFRIESSLSAMADIYSQYL
jgi:glycosyltransferase EpsD